MSIKYLGETFDIHGGGMDLQFPHHECEIAQSTVALGHETVRYWIHNNMITINGQKMARSLGNFITLDEFFSGKHELLTKAYSPMTVRFFILQAHYRSTVDFSNEALQAAEKGLARLMKGAETLKKIVVSEKSTIDVEMLRSKYYEALNDDLNSPILLSFLFETVRLINSAYEGVDKLGIKDLKDLKDLFHTFVFDILGLKDESAEQHDMALTGNLVKMILDSRQEAKTRKDWATSDRIREELTRLGIVIKDRKDGTDWELE
jgi:cysteinyl-tRNA synthetase